MPKVTLTKKKIDSIKNTVSGRIIYWDYKETKRIEVRHLCYCKKFERLYVQRRP
jgi:hypothetical protein